MNSYFDSDEEIAFGPITLREIKFDLNRPRFKVNRRHTTALKINVDDKKEDKGVDEETMHPETHDIPSVSDKYLSATESSKCESKSDLGRRNETSTTDLSVYLTAGETSTVSQRTDIPYLSAEDTMCFVKTAQKLKANFNFEDNSSEILVENTVMSPDNKSLDKLDRSSCSNTSGSYDKVSDKVSSSSYEMNFDCQVPYSDDSIDSVESVEDEVILISSDEESLEELVYGNSVAEDKLISKMKEENLSSNNVSTDQGLSIISSSVSDVEIMENMYSKSSPRLDFKDVESARLLNECLEDCQNILSVIPEETRSTYELMETGRNLSEASTSQSTSQYESVTTDETSTDRAEIVETEEEPNPTADESSASFTLPEIDLAQFDESTQLNDTITLMDRMLKEADERDRKTRDAWSLKTDDIISASFLQQPTSDLRNHPSKSKETSPKSRIPTLRRKSRSLEDFKVPHKPPPASKPFKNIASPVGLYIKYSPQPLLRQNVPARAIRPQTTPTAGRTPTPTGGGLRDLAFVKYKPARRQLCTSEDKLFCPPYIQKMLKDPVVVKHERRIAGRAEAGLAEGRLLEEGDLTRASFSDDSCLDVSVLKQKTALRK